MDFLAGKMKLYSGINSLSFFRGYDPLTKVFDKRKVVGMKRPETIWLTRPLLEYTFSRSLMIHGPSVVRKARKLSLSHGGDH